MFIATLIIQMLKFWTIKFETDKTYSTNKQINSCSRYFIQ